MFQTIFGFSVVFVLTGLMGCGGVGATPDATAEDIPEGTLYSSQLKKLKPKFESCGRDSISVQTGSTQKLKVKFTLSELGKAQNFSIEGLEGPDPDLKYCIVQSLRHAEFPKPKSGKAELVEFPLTLKPQ